MRHELIGRQRQRGERGERTQKSGAQCWPEVRSEPNVRPGCQQGDHDNDKHAQGKRSGDVDREGAPRKAAQRGGPCTADEVARKAAASRPPAKTHDPQRRDDETPRLSAFGRLNVRIDRNLHTHQHLPRRLAESYEAHRRRSADDAKPYRTSRPRNDRFGRTLQREVKGLPARPGTVGRTSSPGPRHSRVSTSARPGTGARCLRQPREVPTHGPWR